MAALSSERIGRAAEPKATRSKVYQPAICSSIIRLWADDDGESHFEDVELTFEEVDDFFENTPPVLMSSFDSAIEYGFEVVPPGWQGDWHPAPQRVLAIYLSGKGEIEASDGEVRPIGPGTILLAEDTVGRGHRNLVTGSSEVSIVLVMLPDIQSKS